MQNALGRGRAFALGRANICYWGNSEVSALREFFAVWPKSDIRAAFWEGPNDNQARAESGHYGMVRNAAGGELCISKDEQSKRFMTQLDESMKRWKF
jgi:hypothetical protein